MGRGTYIQSKEDFLKSMGEFIKDKDYVLVSNIVRDERAQSKKDRTMRIKFAFASDAFKNPDTIEDTLYSPKVAFIVCKKKALSKRLLEILKERDAK